MSELWMEFAGRVQLEILGIVDREQEGLSASDFPEAPDAVVPVRLDRPSVPLARRPIASVAVRVGWPLLGRIFRMVMNTDVAE